MPYPEDGGMRSGSPDDTPPRGGIVSIVVPTYNEAVSLPLLLPRIRAVAPGAEIVIVDDDSPDGTGRLARRLSEEYAPMRVVGRVGERGLATAVLRGIEAAQGELCVVLDADLSHPPEAIPALVEAVRNGADLAIGSRYVQGGGTAGWPVHRRLASWAGGLLVRSLTTVSDPLAGFFCVRKRILAGVDLRPRGFKILLEILVRARPREVAEIPIQFVDRREGRSKFGIRPTYQYLLQLVRLHLATGTVSSRIPSWAWLLAAGTLCRAAMAASVPVLPEEAYHWNFARHLDIGYLDHPPMIAWAIALGRLMFGDGPLGIRAVPLLLSVLAGAALARLAGRLYGPAAAAWAVILFTLHPAVSGISAGGFPDAILLPFWILTLVCVWEAVRDGGLSWWGAAGASLGAAMLSKYTAVFLVPGVALFLAVSRADRRWFRLPGPYLAASVACVVFLPVLAWNATHDWASLRFQSAGRLGELQHFQGRFVARFLLEQWGAHLTITFPLYVAVVWGALRSRRRADLFCMASAAPLLGFFLVIGCHEPVHILWPAAAYLPLHLLVAGAIAEGSGRWARRYGRRPRALAAAGLAFLLVGTLHAACGLPGLPAWKGAGGWGGVVARARALHEEMAPDSFYLGIGRKYACASMLAWGLRSPWDVEAGNLLGYGARQYEYWSVPGVRLGRDAVVVVERAGRTWDVEERLRAAFERVEPAAEYPSPGEEGVRFIFYRAYGYRAFGVWEGAAGLHASR